MNYTDIEMERVGFTEKEGNYIAERTGHFNNAIGVCDRIRDLYIITYDPQTFEETIEQDGFVEFVRELKMEYASH